MKLQRGDRFSTLHPAVKATWLWALRSGHYLQGQQRLRTLRSGHPTITLEGSIEGPPDLRPDSFCCLGVLSDLCGVRWAPLGTHAEAMVEADRDSLIEIAAALGEADYDPDDDTEVDEALLPGVLARALGIAVDPPVLIPEWLSKAHPEWTRAPETLSQLNDAGATFAEIARVIEEQY